MGKWISKVQDRAEREKKRKNEILASKKDSEIIEDRVEKYGHHQEFFETYGQMCELVGNYASMKGKIPNAGHLSALNMVLLKVLRSAWSPSLADNYCDGRNYFSIAEAQVISSSSAKE